MSQRPSAPRPASHSPADAQKASVPSAQRRDDIEQGRRLAVDTAPGRESIEQGPGSLQATMSLGQSPIKQELGPSGHDRRVSAPRVLGVHTILNPTESEGGSHSMAVMQSPRTVSTTVLPSQGSPAQSAYVGNTTFGSHSEAYPASVIQNRRILTPRSPRAASISRTAAPVEQRPSFSSVASSGRLYAEPGQSPRSEILPPPGQQHQSYSFAQAPHPSSTDRRPSGGPPGMVARAARTSPSQSSSPTTSVASHAPGSQVSPSTYPGQPHASGSYFPQAPYAGPLSRNSPTRPPEAGFPSQSIGSQVTAASAGPGGSSSNYQIWTIKHDSGSYQIPVDVQAASKIADEKRARNAGASARFRQRRKEKEREASQSIQKLEMQVRDQERKLRDVEQERDFYRGERNRLRDILWRNPATREVAVQAPPSPRLSGPPATYGYAATTPGGGPGPSYVTPDTITERAPRRRRTESRDEPSNPPAAMAPRPPLMPGQSGGYGVPMPSNLPPLRLDNIQGSGPGAPPTPGGAPLTPRGGQLSTSGPPPGPYPYEQYPRTEGERSWRGPPGPPGPPGPR